MTQAVNRRALLVHHIVIFEQVFAGFEVLALNRLLRFFNPPRDQPRLDGNPLFHAQTLQQIRDPLLGEDAHQIVFEGKIETGRSGIALASGAPAKLVIDAPGLVALGAEDVQSAGGNDFIVLFVSLLFITIQDFRPLGGGDYVLVATVVPDRTLAVVHYGLYLALGGAQRLCDSFLHAFHFGREFRISTEQNIGSAARHVGGNRHHAFASGLGHYLRFFFVLLGVQYPVLQTFFLQQFR